MKEENVQEKSSSKLYILNYILKEDNTQAKPIVTLRHLDEFSSNPCFVDLNNDLIKDSVNIQSRKSYILNRINVAIGEKKEEWEKAFSNHECHRIMTMPPIPIVFVIFSSTNAHLKPEQTIYNIPPDLISDVDNYLRLKKNIYNSRIIVNFQRAISQIQMNQLVLELPPEPKLVSLIQIWGPAIRERKGSAFFNKVKHNNESFSRSNSSSLFLKAKSNNITQNSDINHTDFSEPKNKLKNSYSNHNEENMCYTNTQSAFFNNTNIETNKSKSSINDMSANKKQNHWTIREKLVEPLRTLRKVFI